MSGPRVPEVWDPKPKKHQTTDERLEGMDQVYREQANDLYEKFRRGKFDNAADLLGLTGEVVGFLWKDIIDSKKADSLFKGLGLAASLNKDYLNIDFPEEVIKQFNAKLEDYKASVARVHKELLCPECYKKVSERLGWTEKPKA
jgi:hypothetical protein